MDFAYYHDGELETATSSLEIANLGGEISPEVFWGFLALVMLFVIIGMGGGGGKS